ncbi:hypothetical protein T11_17807 [Trichinella zimbabwensis]|uniref:Uncharacterized protein n=1 Tax=Trichinella zimbabwensis TaxID=268475 RepID=A0A0V1GWE0_9BILA|nr:hypothetical protein T11_17807 [Trichinella zimbabwensis]
MVSTNLSRKNNFSIFTLFPTWIVATGATASAFTAGAASYHFAVAAHLLLLRIASIRTAASIFTVTSITYSALAAHSNGGIVAEPSTAGSGTVPFAQISIFAADESPCIVDELSASELRPTRADDA